METVEDCVTEKQTGFHLGRLKRRFHEGELRASLGVVHSVGNRKRAKLAVRAHNIAMDIGEASR